MGEFRELELKYIIENIELELEFQDLTDKEIKEKMVDLKVAKNKLKHLIK
ncbi:hypothetical protein M4L39_14515 [Staphylococcus equorum]|nr:hypothetical protein [Staphylococcus equorum]MDG0844619.1 hypothetical protein [Staphylococcus equorum]